MQATSIITKQEARLSAENQAKVALDFGALSKAKPAVVALDRKTLKSMYHNEAIRTINDLANQGVFLPLEHASVVITKFCSSRLGTLKEAEKYFALTIKHYRTNETRTDEKISKLFSELIWVYIHKRERDDKRVMELVSECPSKDTYTALTAYYNRGKHFEKTLSLHAKWPQNIAKDGSTYRYWAYALKDSGKTTKEIQAFYEEVRSKHPELMKDPYFVVDYIKLGKRSSRDVVSTDEFAAIIQLFEQFPEYCKEDKLLRELFKAGFDSNNALALKPYLFTSKTLLSVKTWELFAMRLAECTLPSALKVCGDHLGAQIDYEQREIVLNFHKDTISSHGAEEYGAQDFLLIELKIWHLVKILVNPEQFEQKSLKNFTILLITGKGTSLELKKNVKEFLAKTFNWTQDIAPPQSGCIKFDQSRESLIPKLIAYPAKLSKNTALKPKAIH